MPSPAFFAALLAVLLPLPLLAAAAPEHVAEGVFVLPGTFTPGHQPDGNSVLFLGPRGLVVVDTGRHVEHAAALLDFSASRSQPIVAVVNTHWHLDHLGGNSLLRERVPGLEVWASNAVAPALQGWLAASRRDMQTMLDAGTMDAQTQAMLRIDIALIDLGPRLLPDVTLDASRTIDVIGKPLQIGFESDAVTAGDLWVYDSTSGVLATGDLVTLPAPFLDTACAPRWRQALARLEVMPFKTLVPGHGAPLDRAAFVQWRHAFDGLLDCAASDGPASACAEGWITALGPLLPEADRAAAREMTGYYLAQHLRAAPAQRDRFCPVTERHPP
jgi:glyoxylase-like metal-dependent hydrolase (beta-lactamase superfamily II)